VIPDVTVGKFEMRALNPQYLADLKKRAIACIEAGAAASGTTVELDWCTNFQPMNNNRPLAQAYKENAEALGRQFLKIPLESTGSSDQGT
jgi:metal-dependent amidase/aminoacylase/carboxypeptidase family protein